MIDHKFKFVATNPCKGNVFTEENAVVFLAKDKALIPALMVYSEECVVLGSNPEHIESLRLLIGRVKEYQANVECRVPDTETDCEIDRCIRGNV